MHGNVFVGADKCPLSLSMLQIAVAAKRTSRNTILHSLKLVGQNWRDVAKEESAVAAKAVRGRCSVRGPRLAAVAVTF